MWAEKQNNYNITDCESFDGVQKNKQLKGHKTQTCAEKSQF